MAILLTASSHFAEDIGRARKINDHRQKIKPKSLCNDLGRASWMMAVGAADAFFCDAYADLCAKALQAKQIQPSIQLTDKILGLQIPAVAAIQGHASDSWRWRMAARALIEKKSVLSVEEIVGSFNAFCRNDNKLFCSKNKKRLILHTKSRQRVFGISSSQYRKKSIGNTKSVQKEAWDKFEDRYANIFQRRNDCIHNCDRPKIAINDSQINHLQVNKVIEDIEFLVDRFQEIIKDEFSE